MLIKSWLNKSWLKILNNYYLIIIFIYENECSVFILLVSGSSEIYQKFGSFVFIYAIDNLFVCSYFINDCLLVFNTLIFEIYISLVVFAVVFL